VDQQGNGVVVTDQDPPTQPDLAARALEELIAELDVCIEVLQHALRRAEWLHEQRESGKTWREIVPAEPGPLVVESITTALDTLATTGGRWRREQARALHAEGLSINRIAALFGVTRQRISVLVRDRNGDTPADTSS
jgi:hypothetical protein